MLINTLKIVKIVEDFGGIYTQKFKRDVNYNIQQTEIPLPNIQLSLFANEGDIFTDEIDTFEFDLIVLTQKQALDLYLTNKTSTSQVKEATLKAREMNKTPSDEIQDIVTTFIKGATTIS